MAKELPYFKFEPNQWENGNIQICTREEKGVFIDLCSMYWSRIGDLPYKLAVQKLCGGNATALDSLCENQIIKVIDGNICIDFLNEQLSGFENVSSQNSENARLGWEKRRKKGQPSDRNATALNSQSETYAIREENKKEDKIRVEEINIDARKLTFKTNLWENHKNDYPVDLLKEFYLYWTEHGANDKKMRFEKQKSFGLSRRLATWSSNAKKFSSGSNDKKELPPRQVRE